MRSGEQARILLEITRMVCLRKVLRTRACERRCISTPVGHCRGFEGTRHMVNYPPNDAGAPRIGRSGESPTWGGITELIIHRRARQVVVSPGVLHDQRVGPAAVANQLSAAYLIRRHAGGIPSATARTT